MVQEKKSLFGEEKSSPTLRQQTAKYLAYWPIFLLSILLCVGAGLAYVWYATPKYMAVTGFIVKGGKSGEAPSQDLIESAMGGNRQVSLSNDIMLISSLTLMERTVEKNGFNISYFKKGSLKDVDIYDDAPFYVIRKEGSGQHSFKIQVGGINSVGGHYADEKSANTKLPFKWNMPVTINGETIVLIPRKKLSADEAVYAVEWVPVKKAAGKLASTFSARPFDKQTSIIQLSLKTENLERGKDILDALFAEFTISNMEARNELSDSTVSFINDRLVAVTDELKNVEGSLENLQQSRQLVDVGAQTKQSLDNSSETAKAIENINTQQAVTNMISKYIADPANSNRLVPSSLGLDDPNLSSLLNRYNEVLLKKEKEAPNVAPKSTVMQDLNSQAANLKTSILENLNTVNKNLRLQEGNLVQQNRQFTGFLSAVPRNERAMQEIKRKQGITEGLYLYLLQKREEAAISRTSANIAHYTQIDPAHGYGPVDPNKKNIIICTIILGIFLPFAWIYLSGLLNDTITSADEVSQRTGLPLIGTVNYIPKYKKEEIAILQNAAVGEQFRALRTELSLMSKVHPFKTVLVTSPARGEGKSFVSLNLATVCALAGKKVALLEFDLRQPSIHINLGIDNSGGITGFLSGNSKDPSGIFRIPEKVPGLHFYNAGPVPNNPSDLLLSDNLKILFDYLTHENYDYIIIDTPGTGSVSDAFVLNEFADIVLFVVRKGLTTKTQFDFINDHAGQGKFREAAVVFNGQREDKTSSYGRISNSY